ncbi:MAG: DUF5615 family PIN-like protein [Vicinamibacterales bacterium]
MARLLADENFPLPVVEALRRLGHDVVTLADLGKAHQALPDESVLQTATADGRAVATLNRRHFVRLHAENPSHAGIVVCTLDLDFEGQARRLDGLIRGLDALTGQLLRLNRLTTDTP